MELIAVYSGATLLTPAETCLVFLTICTILVLVSIGINKAFSFYAHIFREAFSSNPHDLPDRQ